MNAVDLSPILAEVLDPTTKGYPLSATPLPLSAIGAQGWSLLAGDLSLPLALIRDSALAHNHVWMRDFTAATGVLLAPHGKTTMAPQIFAQQLAAGAWGMTVANVQQLGICARFGVRRVIMANQLLGALEVRAVIGLLRQHPDLEFHFLVDSLAQLACPEPGLAILTLGKRDASYDIEMPIAVKRFRPAADAAPRPAPSAWSIAAMNDQHAYLRFRADEPDPPQVGDLVGCGISHPCTTFDKWRVLFTVDDAYRVTGAIRTYF